MEHLIIIYIVGLVMWATWFTVIFVCEKDYEGDTRVRFLSRMVVFSPFYPLIGLYFSHIIFKYAFFKLP